MNSISQNNPPQTNYFVKLKFSKVQLTVLCDIYHTYWKKLMPEDYNGGAVAVVFNQNYVIPKNHYSGVHSNVRVINFYTPQIIEILNSVFKDVMPYMSHTGNLSLIPPGEVMNPHVDRADRPPAIYFPIDGCSDLCVTDWYNMPKNIQADRQYVESTSILPTYSVAVSNNAVLYNVHEWHGVRNLSNKTRISFGWNTRIEENRQTYFQVIDTFRNLGYLDE